MRLCGAQYVGNHPNIRAFSWLRCKLLRFIDETAGQLRVTSSAKRNDIIFPRRTASVTFGSEWLLLVGVRKA